jgi:NAD+ synthase (glutamine-hydrolysing)
MKVGVSQLNPVLGDFRQNREKIIQAIRSAQENNCQILLFPECTLFGYHPFDLLERKEFVQQQLNEFEKIKKMIPAKMGIMMGLITKNEKKLGKPYFNSAVFLQKGKAPKFFHKELLPTGDVFDEARFIEQGSMQKNFFRFQGHRIFVTICEDIWAWPDAHGHSIYKKNPIQALKNEKVDLILNLSASPFYPGKSEIRHRLLAQTARLLKAPMIYANLVGGQDEIIFDGGSFAVNAKGQKVMQCALFEEDFGIFHTETQKGSFRLNPGSATDLRRQALVLGIQDFCKKTGLQRVHLGLSGGIDSAVVLCLAVQALGAENVSAIALPGPFSAKESLSLAKQLAENLGVHLDVMDISDSYQHMKQKMDQAFGIQNFGLVHENLQARLRGASLMAYSNFKNSLLLATSNKSEIAAGYSTMYGDMCGGLMPIGDLTKKQVYELAVSFNRHQKVIPAGIIDRAPSAELRPDQKDEDTLPPYTQLDKAVQNIVENLGEAKNSTDKWVLHSLLASEFKRFQAPPILKVSSHAFGRGRRWPIAHRLKK